MASHLSLLSPLFLPLFLFCVFVFGVLVSFLPQTVATNPHNRTIHLLYRALRRIHYVVSGIFQGSQIGFFKA
jgi:uncharacterized protein YqhQ